MPAGVLLFILILILSLSLSPGGSVLAQSDSGFLRQWASQVEASSEYGPDDYSASRATGEQDVFGCTTSPNAWASASAGTEETLTFYFDELVQARQINIYININPGTITSVSLLSPDGSPVEIPDSADTGTDDCPRVFSLAVPPRLADDMLTSAIQIELDQRSIDDWTEIDAVELIGVGLEDVSAPDSDTDDSGDERSPADNRRDLDEADRDTGGDRSPDTPIPDGPAGEAIYCDGNLVSDNGVVITVLQMRPNSNYTATVIGLDGFDPVLAVRDASTGDGLCNDDNRDASYYEANLPTTGRVTASTLTSSQVFNTFNYDDFANIELVVGGLNGQSGEFVLILEGMLLSQADNAGDPLALSITPGMVRSGIDPSVYMMSVVSSFDPLIALIDSDYNFITDEAGSSVFCDDAGSASICWGESSNLRNAGVSRTQNRVLSGKDTDAMLTLPITADSVGGNFILLMRSYEMQTYGDYVVAFHVGIGD
jgi:hypothetical protein